MSFEAVSPSTISIPIPVLAGRLKYIVFPTENMIVCAGQYDGGMTVLSKYGSEENKR